MCFHVLSKINWKGPMKRLFVVALLSIVLGSCSTSLVAGHGSLDKDALFLDAIHYVWVPGSEDTRTRLGYEACARLSTGQSFAASVTAISAWRENRGDNKNKALITALTVVIAAINIYCPQYRPEIPRRFLGR
jgi:hypothetical protein